MRKLLVATTILSMVAFSSSVNADGMSGGSSFVGTYVGIDLGYGWGDANSERYGNIGAPYTLTQDNAEIDGFTFGGHLGHNWAIAPNWVLGVEGAVNYSGLEGDDNGDNGDNNEFSADWEGSLTAHVGVEVSPKAMIYVLGGYSWLSGGSNVTDPGEQESVSETYSGWKFGAGLEIACTPNMNVRLQYSHTDYDAERLTFPVNNYDMETGPSVDEVSVGVSWRI